MKNTHRLPAYVNPIRYKIMLRPNLEDFTFYGEEAIHLSLEKPVKKITLHAVDLEIETAEWIHSKQETWAAKISYDKNSETVTLAFPKKLAKGDGEVKLTFQGLLNDKMRGFYTSKYLHQGKEKHLATTQFEATDARRAFPCFDEPNKKAIFEVTLMVPPNKVAISNTIESNILEHESGYKVVEFAPTPKMSTYLLAFIVGDFEYIEDRSKNNKLVRVFTTPGKKEQARFALSVAIKCLDFYEDYFGIDYPLPVLDLIAIPDFASGAMENWGAVTYRESTLLIDESKSSTANKQWVALVIAHELAHMWFGNLVTMEWWTHLWLNEGFASFIEYLAIDRIFPSWDIWTQFVGSEMGVALSLDSLKNTHPIEVSVGHPAEISEIFDKVSYSKGASILRMLHQYLGAKDFQKGLQHYLKKHSFANAQTEDLWKALEEKSNKPVRKIMANWTSKTGYPVVTVREKKGITFDKAQVRSGKLELTQSRFFSSPISRKQSQDKTIWSIPISVFSSIVLMDKKTMLIDYPKDGWVKLNAGETSFFRVDYPYPLLKRLEGEIKSKKLPAPDRLGLIRDVFDLAQSGQSPATLALELVLSYQQEEDYTVWATLTGYFAQLDSLLAYEPFYEDFKKFGRLIYSKIGKKIGWDKKRDELHTDSLLRSLVLNALGGFGDQQTIKKAKELFSSHHIDPDLRGVVYNLVSENGNEDQWNHLVKMYKGEDNQQEKDRIGRSLGKFKSKILLEKTLHFSISKYVRYQNTLAVIASVWGNPQGRYLAWEFIKSNWELLKERYAGGHYFTRVFESAGQFTKKEDALDLEKFVKKNPTAEAQRTIAQVIEQIYSNAEWLKRDKLSIRKFLEKFESEKG